MTSIIYGLVAAVIGCVAFGSFPVPVKTKAAEQLHIDPLVLQTYKVVACFVTSWLILFYEPHVRFSPWGIVSGLFMVPGGTAGYYAFRNAGLAVSEGVASSLKVLVSFAWGVFIFRETVLSSTTGTVFTLGLIFVGLIGMSYSTHSTSKTAPQNDTPDCSETESEDSNSISGREETLADIEEAIFAPHEEHALLPLSAGLSNKTTVVVVDTENRILKKSHWMGIMGAILNGITGGSTLVPMHYAAAEAAAESPLSSSSSSSSSSTHDGSVDFVLSFACGVMIVMILFWIVRYIVMCVKTGSLSEGWNSLPSFYVQTMGPAFFLSGLLWSIGNFCSIISVAILGQAVGYGIIQSSLLVSGLWGIFWCREVNGTKAIISWFIFATLTLWGMIRLSLI